MSMPRLVLFVDLRAASDTDVAPSDDQGVRLIMGSVVRKNLDRLPARRLAELLTAGHHAFESRSVLGAVKARRFAPPA